MSAFDGQTPPFDVDPEFIEENKRSDLCRTRQKSGPYTKAERAKRRKEVYRLHFEQGLPALQIAESMKINRNTVNDDLRLLYQELGREWDQLDLSSFVAGRVSRLESQRARLVEYLKTAKDLETKLSVERLLQETDLRLIALVSRIAHARDGVYNSVVAEMNKYAERKRMEVRFTSLYELVQISRKTRRSLDSVIKAVENDREVR